MQLGTHDDSYYDGPRLRGVFSRKPPKTITQRCHGALGVEDAYTELVTEMKVDRRGAWIHRTLVDYHVDGKAYTLVIPWINIACGTEIRDPEWCDPAWNR